MTPADTMADEGLVALIARLEVGPVYLTHKEAYDLAIFFGSDTALGMASLIRKAFAGSSLDAALALAERVGLRGAEILHAAWSQVSRKYGLHSTFWRPEYGSYSSAVALAACVSILLAKARDGAG